MDNLTFRPLNSKLNEYGWYQILFLAGFREQKRLRFYRDQDGIVQSGQITVQVAFVHLYDEDEGPFVVNLGQKAFSLIGWGVNPDVLYEVRKTNYGPYNGLEYRAVPGPTKPLFTAAYAKAKMDATTLLQRVPDFLDMTKYQKDFMGMKVGDQYEPGFSRTRVTMNESGRIINEVPEGSGREERDIKPTKPTKPTQPSPKGRRLLI